METSKVECKKKVTHALLRNRPTMTLLLTAYMNTSRFYMPPLRKLLTIKAADSETGPTHPLTTTTAHHPHQIFVSSKMNHIFLTSKQTVLFVFLLANFPAPSSNTPLVVANTPPSGRNFSPCRNDSYCSGSRECLTLVSRSAPGKCVDGFYCGCVPRGEASWRCAPDGLCDVNETCMPMPDFFPPDRVCVDNSQVATLENQLQCTSDRDCLRLNQTCLKFFDGSGFCAAKLGPELSGVLAPGETVHSETEQASGDVEAAPLETPISSAIQVEDSVRIHPSPGLLFDDNEIDEMLVASSDASSEMEIDTDQISSSAEHTTPDDPLNNGNQQNTESGIGAETDESQFQLPQASEEPVDKSCIAVHHLKEERSRNALLYNRDVLARVLCDENESCATPGHMVTYRKRAMMMRSYCKLVGKCTERYLKVNGVKYERGKRVESRSAELSFSAFAARFESKLEELVLKTAVHMGL